MASTKAALKAAKSALDSQNWAEAVTQAKIVTAADPKNYFGHVFLGRAREKQGSFDEAVVAYRAATQIKPSEELAWKGLVNVYEGQGSQKVNEYCEASLELAQVYMEKDDQHECHVVVDKLVGFAKENGSRTQYKHALGAYLPSSPIFGYLEGRLQRPGLTYTRLAEITEVEEKERINKEIGERRTRLGAKLGQVTTDVTREVLRTSDLEQLYQNIIDWTTDDELRREYEEKLLQRAYDHLVVLAPQEKASKRPQVTQLAHDMVVIKHVFPLAWHLEFEWKDVENLEELDKGILAEYIDFFPDSGLSDILRVFLEDYLLEREQSSADGGEGDVQKDLKKPLGAEEKLIILGDGLETSGNSAFAHRIVGDHYLQIEEYESCADICRKGRDLLNEEARKSGLSLQNNFDAVNSNLATSLVYYQSPKNHPEAGALFDAILSRKPLATAALLGIGLIYQEQADYEKASSFLSRALARDPGNLRIGTEAAWSKALNGNLEEGLEDLKALLEELKSLKEQQLSLKSQTSYRVGRCLWKLHHGRTERKDRKGAYAYFLAAVKANPEFAPAYTGLGLYYADYARDKKRARQCFQKAFELSASEIHAAERLARIFADDGDWDIVEIVAQRAIDSGAPRPPPGSKRKGVSWPFAAMGIVQMNKQEYPKAVVSFQAALRISPNDYHSWLGLGESYHSSGRYNAAQRTLEHAQGFANSGTEQAVDAWFAQYMLANVHRELGDYEKALDGYHGVLEVRPNDTGIAIALLQTLIERAWLGIETGFFGLAVKCVEGAFTYSESRMDSLSGTFNFWKAIGDACSILTWLPGRVTGSHSSQALKLLGNTVEASETDALSNADNVTLDSVLSQSEASPFRQIILLAILAHKQAVHASSQDFHAQAVAWYNLGWTEHRAYSCLAKEGNAPTQAKLARYAKASVRCFKRAIELEAGNADFWNALGVVTTQLNPRVAQHSFIRSLHLNERSARTWTNLGTLYLLQDDHELAHNAFSRAQSTDPEYAHAWLGEGIIALTVGDAREALSHFTHAVDIADASSLPVKNSYVAAEFDRMVSSKIGDIDLAKLIQPIFVLLQLQTQAAMPMAYRHLVAVLQERVGDYETASNNLEAVCKFAEARYEESESAVDLAQFVQAKSDLARVQLAIGQHESAAENASTVLDLSAEAGSLLLSADQIAKLRLSAHLTAGLANYFLAAMDEAIEMFRAALQESDGTPDIICLLSQVLWAKGGAEEKSVAKEQLFDCIDKHAGHVRATCLLGAMSAIEGDETTHEAVLADLQAMRTNLKMGPAQRQQIEDLLRVLASLSGSADRNSTDETSGVATSIMLAPWKAEGWSALAESSGERYPAEMAMKTAAKQAPPHGVISAEDLSATFARAETVGDAQRSIFLCPWQATGWQTFEACLA